MQFLELANLQQMEFLHMYIFLVPNSVAAPIWRQLPAYLQAFLSNWHYVVRKTADSHVLAPLFCIGRPSAYTLTSCERRIVYAR
jgi:hypothetical protein